MTPAVLLRRVRAVPILVKVLGIGALVAALFGIYALVVARAAMEGVLDDLVRERALGQARDLSHLVERPLAVGDVVALDRLLAKLRASNPELRYAVVRDQRGSAVAHTFPDRPPRALAVAVAGAEPVLRRLASDEGGVVDVAVGVLDGQAGSVQVGLLDRRVGSGVASLTGSLAWGLALCALLGAGLAVLLADALVRPIAVLGRAARAIAAGDLAARAGKASDDEVGRLADDFNRMAAALEGQRADLAARTRDRAELMQRLVQAQEDERRTIARELHDHLGQLLTALLLDIERPAADEAEAAARLRLAGRVRVLVEEVRRMAWGMRPSVLDDFGLVTALARQAEDLGRTGPLRIACEAVGLGEGERLPSAVETALYRIAQEGLTNCLRHAQATSASVVLVRRPGQVSLVVEDDGRGLPAEPPAGRHLGLAGMRERAGLLGGTLTIESAPGQGTTLRVTIPLADAP
ncbi:MAG: HAMP domain-containing protein [Planctomycetes bacterium]|nr:HAMP domain-containing protein [Planctomycetota bacterium]